MNNANIYWLVSYPKSGNTWARMFLANYIFGKVNPVGINELECIPFVSSGAFIETEIGIDYSILTTDEINEFRLEALNIYMKRNKISIIKVHDAFPEQNEFSLFTKEITAGAIYIVRNPLDVAVSFAYHLGLSFEKIIQLLNNEDFYLTDTSSYKFQDQFSQKLSSWSKHVTSWLENFKGNLLLISYEEMLDAPQENFKKMIEFMKLDYDQEHFEKCLELSNFSSLKQQEKKKGFWEKSPAGNAFFRKGKKGTWKHYLQKKQIDAIAHCHGEVMTKLNYL